MLKQAIARLRGRRGRSLLAAVGIAAASIMVGTAVTLSFGLATGFDRAVDRGDLPDIVARFNDAKRADVERRIESLPNLEDTSTAIERNDVGIEQFGTDNNTSRDTITSVDPDARHGYGILEGEDVDGTPGEVVVEQGFANDWNLSVGSTIYIDTIGEVRVVGIALAPDDVAYPLASRARLWLANNWVSDIFIGDGKTVNVAQVWAQDPDQLDPMLVQARQVSFGLENLKFVTVEGVRSLVGQASGLVIALLIAFSLVALGTAGVALGATARADVQRRLSEIGLMRAVGLTRLAVAARYSLDALLIALPATVIGLALGTLVAYGPSSRLLSILSELPPGPALLPPLLGCLAAIIALVVGATVWPAWRAAGKPPATTLRGAELPGTARRTRAPGGPFGLGIRLASARRGRTAVTAIVVGAATAVVLLMLALASFLQNLQDDPGAIGKRYQLTASLPPDRVGDVEAIDGVADASPRYELNALDSFRLAETVDVIAYPGDHTDFEAPPLAEGRRVESGGEAEVGRGLADALGLSVGGTLALQLESGEARFTVVGIDSAIDNEGRVAYVRPDRILAAQPGAPSQIAVKLDDDADEGAVTAALTDLGAEPQAASGTTTRDQRFLGTLAGVLRVVAGVNGLICMFILIQALAVTASERRQALAVLRAAGAGRGAITAVLAGAAAAVLVLAIPVGFALERWVLGPLVSHLAAGYATPGLATPAFQVLIVAAALVALGLVAAWRVALRAERAPIPTELRGT